MRLRTRRHLVLGWLTCLALSAALVAVMAAPAARADDKPPGEGKTDPALERAREEVKMLDDLYKNAVVVVTRAYVDRDDKQPAIMVAKQVFAAMRKKGWHSARLVDATGEPFNDENAPQTDFEKAAYKAIRAGKPYYEQVVGEGQDRRLLAATVVPSVMQKCSDCHTNTKVGDVLGFLRYDIKVK
jgi:hypothetical protein